jgi:hypothetical protein
VSAIRPTQSQSIKLQDSLEMSEEHLDLLAILSRLLVSIGLGNLASDLPCRFMDAASDLPSWRVRTAARLHRASRAIGLAGSIDDGVGLGHVGTQLLEWPPFATQHMALRAVIFVGLFFPLEVAAG